MENYRRRVITVLIFFRKSERTRVFPDFYYFIMSVSDSVLDKLEDLLSVLPIDSKVDELRKLADEAVDKARSNEDLLSEQDLIRGLELRGDLFRQTGGFDDAKTDYVEALGLMSSAKNADEGIGRVCTGLAVVHDLNGDSDLAKSFYQRAIAAFERLTPRPVLDIADISNNLAFIYEAEGDFDKAETFLLGALKSCHETLGPDHEQTASLYNNVGSLYFKAEHDERAKEMHELALEARTKLFGNMHPETAQSHGNLALVLVRAGKVNEGKTHFDEALDGFEKDLDSCGDDYEIVAANYRDVLASMQDDKAVATLNARLLKKGFS
jgi:tetratricopeptide (TPR) repeat protein